MLPGTFPLKKHSILSLFVVLATGPALAHTPVGAQDPALGSGAALNWTLTVLAGALLMVSLGTLLGNLGRNPRLVLAGAGMAVLSATGLAFAGMALWKQQVPSQHISVHHTATGWEAHYGAHKVLKDLLVLPVGQVQSIEIESAAGTDLQVPMLNLSVQVPAGGQQVVAVTVPEAGTYLAADGRLNIKGVESAEFQTLFQEHP